LPPPMGNKLWQFTDALGSFRSHSADKIKTLYFPLCNERIMSSISPDLHGDIKSGQDSFLLTPVSRTDLIDSRSSRNFWIYLDKGEAWSACGVSKNFRQIASDRFTLEAGLLWQKVTRKNKKIGLRAEILSFVPQDEPIEIMQVKLTNIAPRKINFIPTAAIPIYARAAGNLRDHRQVTSLLQRITLHKFGVIVKPTLSFDEAGHKPNKTSYFVLGWQENFRAPEYLYPTQEMFCSNAGDLEAPLAVLKNTLPEKKAPIQGKEAFGALRFKAVSLRPGQSCSYIILMGIEDGNSLGLENIIRRFNSLKKIERAFKNTQDFWIAKSQEATLSCRDRDFENWLRWVSIQPALRKIFGCSFLPDFDYGKGGRGWRDLWQDCLSLILNNPQQVRPLLVNNFSGVRIDGSNATIIGKKTGEFFSDRNNLSRVWMDHAIWPLLTLDLYLNETGDFKILSEETAYFRNHQLCRTKERDSNWSPAYGQQLKTAAGKIYKGTILEHLLVENLVQFFNVGGHNHIRLEGADWNDGLDMAAERGESVAFSAMYAHNLFLLAEMLLKAGKRKIKIFRELKILLAKVNYTSPAAKNKILKAYFNRTKFCLCAEKTEIDTAWLAQNLREKASWMMQHIRRKEWLKEGFFNGYYDNKGRPVEGKRNGILRMILTSQVLNILSGVAEEKQVADILKSVKKRLFDKEFKGYRLNTDFKEEQHALGRAFSFVYGDKENGAFFNHMAVMFAYALYKRGFSKEGWEVLHSIYEMAIDTRSKIYPCLPEYFNAQGRGMYSYLTGSASWFILTLLTQVFGISGTDGNLWIKPQLCPAQFKNTSLITLERIFAGRKIKVNFYGSRKIKQPNRISKARLNWRQLAITDTASLIISRKTILALSARRTHTVDIVLG